VEHVRHRSGCAAWGSEHPQQWRSGDEALCNCGAAEWFKPKPAASASPQAKGEDREETTLQRLNRCRAVLRMHGVLSDAENRRILERIVGNYSAPLSTPDEKSALAASLEAEKDRT